VVVGASLALFAWRAPRSAWGRALACVSRESLLLATTCCWWPACGAVLLGTLYPLLLDALGLGKISVGAPYFEGAYPVRFTACTWPTWAWLLR
jgi:cytochrome c-type biogenesis protein CcmF